MDESVKVVRLTDRDRARAAEALSRAFFDDVLYRYIFPGEQERAQKLPWMADGLLAYALRYGEVYTTETISGVAGWLAPGKTDMTLWGMMRTGFSLPRLVMSLNKHSRRRFQAMLDLSDKLHKRSVSEPHWYLAILGVDPGYQGKGVGSALLQPVLTKADHTKTPCYLETQTENNVRFYQKHMFEVTHVELIPGSEQKLWAMVRPHQNRLP